MNTVLHYRLTMLLEGGTAARDYATLRQALQDIGATLGPFRVDLVTKQYVDEELVNEHVWSV